MYSWDDVHGAGAVATQVACSSDEFYRCFEHVVEEPFAVLLDSAASESRFCKQSVIAFGPRAVFAARSSQLLAAGLADIELSTWEDRRFGPAQRVRRYHAAPFEELEHLLAEAQLPAAARAQLPEGFVGGAIGFVGYDAARFLEQLPERAARDLDVPELCFLFVDVVLRFDHKTGVAEWVASARGRDQAHARSRCAALLADYSDRWSQGASGPSGAGQPRARNQGVGPVYAYADEQVYAESVRAAQDHILAGDAFEVCISHRLEAAMPSSRAAAWSLYQALRAQSPAPFACCVLTPWGSLLSSSPERFLQLGADRWAQSRPIKGTRPRGADAAEDESLKRELETSDKDRAENVMIVDLVRNDLGRVCEVGSVHVPELMVVETHPRVFQLVSEVRGRLEDGVSPLALFCACFPPGSMTGAPKIESMKIIDELEPYRRAVYAGAVGYFDLNGAMDFSVVIRSFVIAAERCTLSVGGAVVADSDPVGEYRESMDKARALLAALEAERARGDEAADPR